METKITVTIKEETTSTPIVITPKEWQLIEKKRAEEARKALVESYRQEMADLLARMEKDKVHLRSYYGTKLTYTECTCLATDFYQVSDTVSII